MRAAIDRKLAPWYSMGMINNMQMTLEQRANEMLNNWTPETASLIATLKRHGFEIMKGDNGEETFLCNPGRDGMKTFIANLIACDEAHLYVKCPKTGKTRWIYLVLGNSPGELASDYSIPVELTADEDPMANATEEHYVRWDGRKQPTWTAAEAYPTIYGPAGTKHAPSKALPILPRAIGKIATMKRRNKARRKSAMKL